MVGDSGPGRRVDPPDVSTYYTVTHPEQQSADWRSFYDLADQRTEAVRSRIPHELDLAYGGHRRQALDLYLPSFPVERAPVFVFVHGGGFREGDRAHYGFVAAPLAANGIVTIVPGYRLLPESTYFDAVDDVRSALAWVVEHVARYGGDPRGVFVGGHSAGGILAALVGADTTWLAERALPRGLLRGFVPISAGYDFTAKDSPSYAGKRFADERERRAASPLLNIRESARRALVAVGSREELYVDSSRAFFGELEANGVAAELLVLDGLGHDGTALSLGDEESELSRSLLRTMAP